MAGLVLGIVVSEEGSDAADQQPEQHLRLFAREQQAPGLDAIRHGFSLREAADGTAFTVPGPPLILSRGETTHITVVNTMQEATTVHWHGLELQSVYDGVAGWSRSGSRVAPLVLPGKSFEVYIQPPRAGTFIYHSHMAETEQLASGMYGPLLVLEPGQIFNPAIDRIFVLGDAIDGDIQGLTINGRREPEPMKFNGTPI